MEPQGKSDPWAGYGKLVPTVITEPSLGRHHENTTTLRLRGQIPQKKREAFDPRYSQEGTLKKLGLQLDRLYLTNYAIRQLPTKASRTLPAINIRKYNVWLRRELISPVAIAGCENLTVLSLNNCKLNELPPIGESLSTLELVECTAGSTESHSKSPTHGLWEFKQLKNLKTIKLRNCCGRLTFFPSDTATARLSTLFIDRQNVGTEFHPKWLQDDHFGELPNTLRTVSLKRSDVTQATIEKLPKRLRSLNVEKCPKLPSAVVLEKRFPACMIVQEPIGSIDRLILRFAQSFNRWDRRLDLRSRALGDNEIEALAEAVTQGQGYESISIDLSWNEIGNRGATKLAKALAQNGLPWKLNLSHNRIEDEGAKELAKTIAQASISLSYPIRTLDLSHNQIGDEGAKELGKAIIIKSSLRRLDLSWNAIGDEGVQELGKKLAQHSRLTDLDLSHNQIGAVVLRQIRQSIRSNRRHREQRNEHSPRFCAQSKPSNRREWSLFEITTDSLPVKFGALQNTISWTEIGTFKQLNFLQFTDCKLDGLPPMSPRLAHLALERCSSVERVRPEPSVENDYWSFNQLGDLRAVTFRDCQFPLRFTPRDTAEAKLHTLVIANHNVGTWMRPARLTTANFGQLPKSLTELSLAGSNITGEILEKIPTTLHFLNLKRCLFVPTHSQTFERLRNCSIKGIPEGVNSQKKLLRQRLESRVIGQPDAIEAVLPSLLPGSRVDLSGRGPTVFCFVGPPGTPQGVLAQAMADESGRRFFHHEMQRYQKEESLEAFKQSVRRAVNKPSGSVIMLEDFEKANKSLRQFVARDVLASPQKGNASSLFANAIVILRFAADVGAIRTKVACGVVREERISLKVVQFKKPDSRLKQKIGEFANELSQRYGIGVSIEDTAWISRFGHLDTLSQRERISKKKSILEGFKQEVDQLIQNAVSSKTTVMSKGDLLQVMAVPKGKGKQALSVETVGGRQELG